MLLKKSQQPNTDVNWKNAIGEPLLQAAVRNKNQQMIKLLLDYGAQANAQNYFDNSSLHLAAELGELAIVQLLLEKGADRSIENMLGETALDLATETKQQAIIDALNAEVENASTFTASDLAGFN